MKPVNHKLRVLHLARWYPNRTDPMPGLFIRRHAEATALYADAAVVYAHGVAPVAGKKVPVYEMDFTETNGVRTACVYYRLPRYKVPLLSQAIGLLRFFRAQRMGITKVKPCNARFDVVHVHVLTRLGILGLFYRWFYGTPYVITEHWTRYLPVRNAFRGSWRKMLTRLVVKQAAVVTTVSVDLMQAMQRHGLRHPDYRVIDNVVDGAFFDVPLPGKAMREKARREFVHVSCFTDVHKNISGLLRVVKTLSEHRDDFHFTLVGEGEDLEKMKAYARELQIPEKVLTFTGLLEGRALAETMAQADALVIFSHYENMPVVINESFVLGVPVFSTRVGGIAEKVDNDHGRLVARGDEAALTALVSDFLDGKITCDREKIRRQAREVYSARAVGKKLLEIYQDAVMRSHPVR